jgi:hypothetical protein
MQDGNEPYWSIGMNGKGPQHCHAMVYTNEDDARLVAAAPDLLEVCKAALKVIGMAQENHPYDPFCVDCYDTGLSSSISDALRAVIAKAEGRADV